MNWNRLAWVVMAVALVIDAVVSIWGPQGWADVTFIIAMLSVAAAWLVDVRTPRESA